MAYRLLLEYLKERGKAKLHETHLSKINLNPPKRGTTMNLVTFSPSNKVIVVQVEAYETMEIAWRRHLREHPEDKLSRTKIFHFDQREVS
jgi:hypothetical protein